MWRVAAVLAAAVVPGVAAACSCTWFFFDEKEAELRAAAARADAVVVGHVVADTRVAACRGPVGITVPFYRTLRIGRTLRGEAAGDVAVEAGRVTPTAAGCTEGRNSCQVRPPVGARVVWALRRIEGGWTFADVCTADAARRLAVRDGLVPAAGDGGEIDAVRRAEEHRR